MEELPLDGARMVDLKLRLDLNKPGPILHLANFIIPLRWDYARRLANWLQF